jgi:hypothetical protein
VAGGGQFLANGCLGDGHIGGRQGSQRKPQGDQTGQEKMKPLRWYDYLTINLFWLGLNIRNTAVGSVFMPYLVGGQPAAVPAQRGGAAESTRRGQGGD